MRRCGGTTSPVPDRSRLGITGTCGTPGPFPTIRSCRRNSVYLMEPTSCCQLYRFGPCSPGHRRSRYPVSIPESVGRCSPASRSRAPDVDFTKGGINLLSANSVASGSQRDVIPRAGHRVGIGDDASPAGVGARDRRELLSCSLVSPICWTRSAICVVWAASVSVAGPASDISSPSRSVLGLDLIDERRRLGQRGRDLLGARIERAQRAVGLADQIAEGLTLVTGGLAETVDDVGEVAHRAAVDQDRRRAEHRLDRRRRRRRFQPMRVARLAAAERPDRRGLGGFSATNTSPSGVAERSSAVLPRGSWTPSMMRSVVTAV